MIHLDLQVTSKIINEDAMEMIRMEIRRRMMTLVFEAVDAVATREGMRFSHKDVGVTGDIKIV